MSNRSKKNPLVKEANDTLKRILISPECRSHMMKLMTGTKPKNGKESLEWSLSNNKYLEIENKYNKKLAEYITCLRHEMVSRIKDCVQTNKENKAKDKDRVIIPADKFDEYWNDKIILERDLQKYIDVSHLYNGIKRRVINDYCYSVFTYLQHMYGSQLPIAEYNIDYYKILLKIYEKHKNEYNLEFPFFPEEHLFKPIIPDNS